MRDLPLFTIQESREATASAHCCGFPDTSVALKIFDEDPSSQNLARIVSCLLLQAAREFCAELETGMPGHSDRHHASTNVFLFESVAYLWCMLSFETQQIVRHEFEADRDAVTRSMLDGFNMTMPLLKQGWPGFYPDDYALSRIFLYPKDKIEAAERFCRVLLSSQELTLPMLPDVLRREGENHVSENAHAALRAHIQKLNDDKMPALNEHIARLISRLLYP